MKNALVTGARGFIGSVLCKMLLTNGYTVTAFVRDSNPWTKPRLEEHDLIKSFIAQGKLKLIQGDLNGDISGICEGIDVVYNLAARTFVDHSIRHAEPFVKSNVVGTVNILEEARRQKVPAYFQISTDEVYGQILEGYHDETAPICPRNPYAASKAGADAFVISYAHTYNMWTCVTRTENNYGPFQHPQKVFPNFVGKALQDKSLPVYGDGKHIRQWLHVCDHAQALIDLYEKGFLAKKINSGEVFHIAGKQEITNTELAQRILSELNKPLHKIVYIEDHDIRPGHDKRYALTCDKIKDAVGWTPSVSLDEGFKETVLWYKENPEWTYRS